MSLCRTGVKDQWEQQEKSGCAAQQVGCFTQHIGALVSGCPKDCSKGILSSYNLILSCTEDAQF